MKLYKLKDIRFIHWEFYEPPGGMGECWICKNKPATAFVDIDLEYGSSMNNILACNLCLKLEPEHMVILIRQPDAKLKQEDFCQPTDYTGPYTKTQVSELIQELDEMEGKDDDDL